MKHSLLLIGFIFFNPSCKKPADQVPTVPVNIYLYASDPEFNNLNVIGGWVYLNGGSRGIVAYRKSQEEIMAYDRHCTFQPSNACAKVFVDLTGIIAKDTCCGSEFILTDGSVSMGPAVNPLVSYRTAFDGNVLVIDN